MDMRRRFMGETLAEPLEVAYYPISQASATIPIKPEYRYMDIVAIAAGGRANDASEMSGCGSGGAFIVRKLKPTVGRISYNIASGITGITINMSTDISFTLGAGSQSGGGSTPNLSQIEGINNFIDQDNGGYFNMALSGGGGYGGGRDYTVVANESTGGRGGQGGKFGYYGANGGVDSSGLHNGIPGSEGSSTYSLSEKPFKIADIIAPGNPGDGQPGGGGIRAGYYYIYGGTGGGGAGLSYRGSGGDGGTSGSDGDKTHPGSGQNYGAGMSGIPRDGYPHAANYKGGDPLFLIIYHNDNIPNDI